MIGRGGMWWGKRRDVCVCVVGGERDRQTDRQTDGQKGRREEKKVSNDGVMHVHDVRP